jgi:CubicO group peptidase (beta-lactamase class C family)
MRKLALLSLLIPLAACRAQTSEQAIAQHIATIENALLPQVLIEGEEPVTATLAERMEHHNVPAVSIAVFNDGKIEWARAYGTADVETGRPVTERTLFQAASISKPVAATGMLTLVEEGVLDLDTDVNTWLKSWQVPANDYQSGEPVTLRRLVTHTAGMTVHGFPGYARGDEVPGTVGVLDGAGNTDPVRVDTTPGSLWRYSGGGYTVMQLVVADVTGRPFPEVMRERVLEPAGMAESTYEQPLPEPRREQAATAYRSNGEPVEGVWHTYPEMAAAGLWTNPSELARWAMSIQRSYSGDDGVLSQEMAREMLEPGMNGWGLGPAIHTSGEYFQHGGSNEGFRCGFVAFFEGGRGVAVMTNSDNGGDLIAEIFATLAFDYGWSAMQPEERVVAEIDRAIYEEVAGEYELPFGTVTIALEEGRLWVEVSWEPGRNELLPESETEFFTRGDGTELTFLREGGRVVGFDVYGNTADKVR